MAKHILIVDDEPDILEILRFNLEMEGYEVATAENPVTAQAMIDGQLSNSKLVNGQLPDLIIADVMMEPISTLIG